MNALNGFVNTGVDASTVDNMNLESVKEQFGPFTNAACCAVAFANDMKHVHLHAHGEDFDKIHDLAQSLYERASEESDVLSEMAMEYKDAIPNFSEAATVVNWGIARDEKYNYGDAIVVIIDRLNKYINSLRFLRNVNGTTEDVQSKLDDMIRDWNVELQYKLDKRIGN